MFDRGYANDRRPRVRVFGVPMAGKNCVSYYQAAVTCDWTSLSVWPHRRIVVLVPIPASARCYRASSPPLFFSFCLTPWQVPTPFATHLLQTGRHQAETSQLSSRSTLTCTDVTKTKKNRLLSEPREYTKKSSCSYYSVKRVNISIFSLTKKL